MRRHSERAAAVDLEDLAALQAHQARVGEVEGNGDARRDVGAEPLVRQPGVRAARECRAARARRGGAAEAVFQPRALDAHPEVLDAQLQKLFVGQGRPGRLAWHGLGEAIAGRSDAVTVRRLRQPAVVAIDAASGVPAFDATSLSAAGTGGAEAAIWAAWRSSLDALGLVCLAGPAAAAVDVDLELVLAVDVSRSMDYDEQKLQRDGYVAAFRHPEVIRGDPVRRRRPHRRHLHGMVGTVLSAGAGAVDGRSAAARRPRPLRRRSRQVPITREMGTSISGGLEAAARLFVSSGARGEPPGDRRLRRRAEQHGPAGGGDARFGGRAGDRHQRPADRAEDGRRLQPVQHSRTSTSTTRIA